MFSERIQMNDVCPTIVGKLVTLKPYTREDCHSFYKGYIADRQMTYDVFSYDQQKIDDYYSLKTSEKNRIIFGIYREDSIIGEIQLKYINFSAAYATISIILKDDTVKGKGYGTEAEKIILKYAFEKLDLNRIYADTTARNVRSKHILKKLGFEHIKDKNEMCYFVLKSSNIMPID